VVYKNFFSKIHFKPDVKIPEYYSSWNHADSTLWVSLHLQAETECALWIDQELEDEFGNKLGKEISLTFSTSPYSPSVTMTTGHGILETYGDFRYPLYALNVQEVLFQGANVKKEEVIPLLTTKKIFWESEKF